MPIDCQLFELTAEKVYDQDYEHLEYLPLINHRVFPIGTDPNNPNLGTSRQGNILNDSFRATYYRFIHLLAHQD